MVYRNAGEYAVSQVEYVARTRAESPQDRPDFLPYVLRRGIQECRIEISLQGYAFSDQAPRGGDIHGPVESDNVRPYRREVFERMRGPP